MGKKSIKTDFFLKFIVCLYFTTKSYGLKESYGACIGGFISDPLNNKIFLCKLDSYGKQRQATELDCIFPFILPNGTSVYTCITMNLSITDKIEKPWCSLDKLYQNRTVYCEKTCPKLAQNNKTQNLIHSNCLNKSQNVISFIPDSFEKDQILTLHNYIRAQVNFQNFK